MIALLLPLAGRLVGPKFAKLAAWAMLVLAAIAALGAIWGAWTLIVHSHDKGVIAKHEAVISNQVTAETAAGTNTANAADNVQAATDNAAAVQIQEDIHNATVAHPKEAHASAGPVSQSALDRLRHRTSPIHRAAP